MPPSWDELFWKVVWWFCRFAVWSFGCICLHVLWRTLHDGIGRNDILQGTITLCCVMLPILWAALLLPEAVKLFYEEQK